MRFDFLKTIALAACCVWASGAAAQEWEDSVDVDYYMATDYWETVDSVELDTCAAEEVQQAVGRLDGHDYIDLGLSVMWATCNVGAASATDYGGLYAWGDPTGTKPLSYSYFDFPAINIGGDGRYDIARAQWGGAWRLPSLHEVDELCKRCTWQWVTEGGVAGCRVTGPNGNSIFLPAAGYGEESNILHRGVAGYYWTGDMDPDTEDFECFMKFSSDEHRWLSYYPNEGHSVRPVASRQADVAQSNDLDAVDALVALFAGLAGSGDAAYAAELTGIATTQAVDLGLSVKWASFNVGGDSPEDYGGLFGWADDHNNRSRHLDEYPSANPPEHISGDYRYDICYNWGDPWRLPTAAEARELCDKCAWQWGTYHGVMGYKVTGPSGKSIFLPASGSRSGDEVIERDLVGYYWTGDLDTEAITSAYAIVMGRTYHEVGNYRRYYGHAIRPVTK